MGSLSSLPKTRHTSHRRRANRWTHYRQTAAAIPAAAPSAHPAQRRVLSPASPAPFPRWLFAFLIVLNLIGGLTLILAWHQAEDAIYYTENALLAISDSILVPTLQELIREWNHDQKPRKEPNP